MVLVCNKSFADLAAALPYWDRIIPVDLYLVRRDAMYRWNLVRHLLREGFEVAVQPAYSRSIDTDLLVRATRAPVRIGLSGDAANLPENSKAICDSWYTQLVSSPGNLQPEWRRSRDFIATLLGRSVPRTVTSLSSISKSTPVLSDPSYFILFPGAASAGRRWPVDRFAEIGRWLHASRGWIPVVAGGPLDREVAGALCEAIGPASINLADRTSLIDFVVCMREARILISNDTSAIHIADAVKTPAVGILGGGQFGRFMPYAEDFASPLAAFVDMPCFNCNWYCQFRVAADEPKPCLTAVEVELVKSLVKKALENADGKQGRRPEMESPDLRRHGESS